ncbi:monovalent cation/H(+) antiporter subunit G [Corynebacterium sp. MSK297]|uniref:monovalent cation/H(+) antiporter subunit G n=1 Tax=Corynebacterium sp. MSK297 TaxID=3050221 RepID=UPI00254A25B7|nr:monovalent cation/H(+) antiporter subunit G [Corynebacterium sp. MSK297]MDK8845716.1 monovalent cation/H(+) antiporter subunit G [Corynebacterium sp. MSK297]
MNWALLADIVSLVLVTMGAIFVFSAAIGVARFGDTMSRVHAVTKPQTAGLIMCIIGAGIHLVVADYNNGWQSDIGVLFLLVIFALLTSPVTAQRLGRIGRREGLYAPDSAMSRNDRPAKRTLRKKDPRKN